MRYLLFTFLVLIGSSCQQSKPADLAVEKSGFILPAPPKWTTESFPVPPSFAPEISFRGVEDIRFAPGWSKPGSDDYWTYAFVWKLEGSPVIDWGAVEDYLKAYYTGLIQANGEGKGIPRSKMGEAAVELTPSGSPGEFRGEIHMMDYMTQQPITLRFVIEVNVCPEIEQVYVFHRLSPKSESDPVWDKMNELWRDFKCD